MISTHVQSNSVDQTLRDLIGRLGTSATERFMVQWGAGVKRKAQINALAKGGRKFWREVARSVNVVSASATSVIVNTTSPGGAHKQTGGAISAPGKGPWAKGAAALTIPTHENPQPDRMAGEWKGIFRIPGTNVLARALGARGAKGLQILFVLVQRTKEQKADKWWPETAYVNRLGMKLALNMLAKGEPAGGAA